MCNTMRALWYRVFNITCRTTSHESNLRRFRLNHDDVIKWKHFPRYWPFVRGIHRWIPRTKASDAELWCFIWSAPWINGWVSNREAGDLKRLRIGYADPAKKWLGWNKTSYIYSKSLWHGSAPFYLLWSTLKHCFQLCDTYIISHACGVLKHKHIHIYVCVYLHSYRHRNSMNIRLLRLHSLIFIIRIPIFAKTVFL